MNKLNSLGYSRNRGCVGIENKVVVVLVNIASKIVEIVEVTVVVVVVVVP